MKLDQFDSLLGQNSYVRCTGKERIDPAIVSIESAESHLFSRGTIGWWVRTGYIVVDIDEGQTEAMEIIKKLKLKTLMCKTPKGVHIYFKNTQEYPQKVGMVLPFGLKCDFRCANKGYVMLPYGMSDRNFNKIQDIAEMPLEFTPMVNRKESLLNLKEGDGRNATLFAHLMAYKNRGATADQIEVMANLINKVIFKDPMDQVELEKIVENTEKYKAQLGGENPYLLYTSKGLANGINSRAICDYFVNKGDVFCLGSECYMYFNGVYKESSSIIRNNIREMIGVDHLITQNRIMECFRLILDDIRLQKDTSDINRHKQLINFKNGVWDIEKKELIKHDSKYLQTIQIPHDYKDATKQFESTKLYEFLNDKCKLVEEDLDMFLDYFAYTLTLDFGLKTFLALQGQSNTGKSVLIRFVENTVGHENTSNLSMQKLAMRFYPTQLYNRLLNSCADNSSLALKSIELLKNITGGDKIMYERKGKEPFFFTPFAKLLFSFNQLPLQLEEKSNAFYKRMRVLHMGIELFLNNFYVDKLCSEKSIEETIPHLVARLPLYEIRTTESSDAWIRHLQYASDSITAFAMDCCIVGNPKNKIDTKTLYNCYSMYCIDQGREPLKKHTFSRHLRDMGYKTKRNTKRQDLNYYWFGIKLKDEEGKQNV